MLTAIPHKQLTPKEVDKLVENQYLGLDLNFDESQISNILLDNARSAQFDNEVMELLDYMSRPENFYYTCKHLFNVHLMPFQVTILRELWCRKFPMLIATRGGGKSFLLALYTMIRAVFHQGCKIVLVGAAFRQSKILFEYMEQFWRASPVLRHMVGSGKHQGPKRDIDRCNFYIGESEITAIPIGTGEKIRGLRANYTIADEFSCLEKNSLVETENGLVRIGEHDCRGIRLYTGDETCPYEEPQNYIVTPLTDVYEITLRNGYVIRCSKNHQVMTQDGWKTPLELTDKDYIESENNYKFPEKAPEGLDEDLAWLMGFLTAGGIVYDKKLRDKLLHFGLDYLDKKVPWSILQSPRNIITSYLCGIFRGELCANTVYRDSSEVLCRDIHVLLDKLGYGASIGYNKKWIVRVNSGPSSEHSDVRFRQVKSVRKLDEKQHLYDYYLPKTNSFYACGSRQHNSIPLEIFEVVIKGFAAVSSGPQERAKSVARIEILKSLGMYAEADDVDIGFGNQTVISGTAYYSFNHFYDYWLRYKQIIESKGEKRKLEEIFEGEVPSSFNWKDFSIFRIPWKKIPSGFMDESQISQAQATVHKALFDMEYNAEFARDSDGFFKRSLIETCVCKEPINVPSGPVHFSAMLRGSPNCTYVYGIDPASEHDNFSIVVLEVHPDHRRIVYSWSITRQSLRERISKGGKTTQKSFYTYCARKIRDLMKIFPTEHIAIDSQGGGIAIMEALHDPDEYDASKGERPLWPWIRRGSNDVFWWEAADKPSDIEPGLHILHMVNFANADFTRDANHFMRKDFESKVTLFPYFDPVTISEAISLDKVHQRTYDTLEDCVMEIEELKDELATIQHTQTPAGRDKWDTPEIKMPGNKKGRMRKDRYSALVIANMIAHVMDHELPGPVQHEFVGGYAGQHRGPRASSGKLYVGPDHVVSKMNKGVYGRGVRRH